MPEIRYTEQFIRDMRSVKLAAKRQELRSRIEQLAAFPEIGSSNIPESIRETYGQNVRKLIVNSFVVVYEINLSADAIDILALVHQRAAW